MAKAKFPVECLQVGHLYLMKNGDSVFVPLGATRRDAPKDTGPLRYVGLHYRNCKGWLNELLPMPLPRRPRK